VATLFALDVGAELALVELVNDLRGLASELEGLLDGFEEHAEELLHVLLLEGLVAVPPKRVCKIASVNVVFVAKLKFCKQLLKLVRNAARFISVDICIIPPFIHAFSQFGSHEECLNSTVHVACCPLIVETDVLLDAHIISQLSKFVSYLGELVCLAEKGSVR